MNLTQEQLNLWEKMNESLRNGMNIQFYNAFVKPMKLFAITSDKIIATIKDPFILSHVQGKMFGMLESVVRNTFGTNYALEIIAEDDVNRQKQLMSSTMLNPKYTFENFVVGSSNNFAYAASIAVAEQPSEVYNPLFIYGDVGLGKTHLMNAIGNYIMTENPLTNILLTSSERFTNELIESIVKKKGGTQLRDKMRNVDVLMIDDIQFLSKTTATQEEFFHTFNDLYNNHKQIIISSDRPPKELPTIEDRLRSRFEWGLIVDIRRPDFETRVAILKQKADAEYIDIPYDVIEYIASHFESSIRELEGALTRVQALAKLLNEPISMDLALQALSQLTTGSEEHKLMPDIIIPIVARQYDVDAADILSKKRTQEIAVPRQIAIYICREMTDLSTTNIGKAFGGRDHTTVMHSCDKVAEKMRNDPAFKKKVTEIMDLIHAHTSRNSLLLD